MTDATPMFSAHVEQLIHELKWADDTPDEVVTLVAGNIRGAVSRLIEDGVLVPLDEVSDRVAELFETSKAIAAMTPTPQEPRCAKCGHPKSNHPYRHPFVSIAQDAAMDRLVSEGQRCDAMRCAECDCENGGDECTWITPANPEVTPQERHADTERNLILNGTLTDLDQIINSHDPETDTSINNAVWGRLDKMACEIEARSMTPQEAAKVLLEKMTHHHLPLALMTEADDEGKHLQWVLVDASSNTLLGSGETALEALRAISEDSQ